MIQKDYFKDKKITIIGVGAHGEMLTDIKFLLKNKAILSVYDIRSESRLSDIALEIKELPLSNYKFGNLDGSDFIDSDLIIISNEISRKSTFLKKAIDAGVPVEYADILFFKLVPTITLIGVLGMYGKSTVAHLIYEMLNESFVDYEDQGLFVIDSDSRFGVLTHLKKIKKGDVVLVKIPENLIPYYNDIHISPHVAVLTSKVNSKILEYQTYNNFIVASDAVIDSIKDEMEIRAKILRTRASSVPNDWIAHRSMVYDRENASLALQTSELFKVSRDISKDVIQGFLGLKGHIEMIKRVQGIEYYNDACSVTPQSTLSALRSLSKNRNIVLIMGGSYTGHDYGQLIKELPNYVHTLILLPGSGTIGLRNSIERLIDIKILHSIDLEDAVNLAKENASKNDIVLYSPAFDAVGIHISRRGRTETFSKIIKKLK